MFLKRTSALRKALRKYQHLFLGWEGCHQNDACIEECIFKKGNKTVVFQEDLREHIVNLFVNHPEKRVGKIYYRQVYHGEDLIDLTWLKNSLAALGNKNNVEQQEVDLYIRFLKANEII